MGHRFFGSTSESNSDSNSDIINNSDENRESKSFSNGNNNSDSDNSIDFFDNKVNFQHYSDRNFWYIEANILYGQELI